MSVNTTSDFAEMGLSTPLLQQLKKQGITAAFPIQAAVIPDILSKRDVLGRAPTGSGKTLAFGLPLLENIAKGGISQTHHPRGLVLAPTRELATQIYETLADYAAVLGLRILHVVGGVAIKNHIRSLAAPVDVLIATPGRVLDLMKQKELFLDQVQVSVLDEADQMADLGFFPQVQKILSLTEPTTQRLLFSATLDSDVDKLVAQFMVDPVIHSVVDAAANTTHTLPRKDYCFFVENISTRDAVLAHIAARRGRTIVFAGTKIAVDRYTLQLREKGIHAAALHGGKGQRMREYILEEFSSGRISVLVATDVAARGIDISAIDLVVHADIPADHKAYIHRSGRTARAGASGTVITLALTQQHNRFMQLFRQAQCNPEEHTVDEHSSVLRHIAGARAPSGKALAPLALPENDSGKKNGRPISGNGYDKNPRNVYGRSSYKKSSKKKNRYSSTKKHGK
ncbi:DEAD/DEAH box helicase [Corynebacterium sp. sy017]|uniref:DEAD/DEAH box helicase n=1 Tax=unclassified Corynebacterium TaxID=2624378 RepID=UPI001186DE8E|nr:MULTISPECIES: DEAD/DEAH box helicase [unclassified Corynebacterium]MBP3087579.1 DEAD/DEAH box helicase [Corynebacterium sp. sy017]TSD92155.1 DEAD/DEAH box helicase [Corynebacterium sp. SY003]